MSFYYPKEEENRRPVTCGEVLGLTLLAALLLQIRPVLDNLAKT